MQNIQFKKKRIEDKAGEENSVVARNSRFVGKISGNEGILVSGRLKGDVKSEQLVWIQSGGGIIGDIDSPFVIIEGDLKGNIKSAEHVEIRSQARITGNIQTQKIAMAEGSSFQGEIHMPRKEDKPISFVEKRQNIK
jgi:cytoskeletal protein CcmA (bactofilin family)